MVFRWNVEYQTVGDEIHEVGICDVFDEPGWVDAFAVGVDSIGSE